MPFYPMSASFPNTGQSAGLATLKAQFIAYQTGFTAAVTLSSQDPFGVVALTSLLEDVCSMSPQTVLQ